MSRDGRQTGPSRARRWRRAAAWGVHFYTALGLVLAALVAVLLANATGPGRGEAFRTCFLLLFAATLVDATDGTLARAVRIKETLPEFDGRRLDDLVDFLTYTCLPLLLIWRLEIVPDGWEAILLFPLLASAYGFCQTAVKTDDGYFLGFPSYWNILALYLYVLQPLPTWVTMAMLIVPAVLTFVPFRYLYPSQGGSMLNLATSVLGAVWAGLLLWIMLALPGDYLENQGGAWPRSLAVASLYYPFIYLAASWGVTLAVWQRHRKARKHLPRAA